jgi:hypothetical protein
MAPGKQVLGGWCKPRDQLCKPCGDVCHQPSIQVHDDELRLWLQQNPVFSRDKALGCAWSYLGRKRSGVEKDYNIKVTIRNDQLQKRFDRSVNLGYITMQYTYLKMSGGWDRYKAAHDSPDSEFKDSSGQAACSAKVALALDMCHATNVSGLTGYIDPNMDEVEKQRLCTLMQQHIQRIFWCAIEKTAECNLDDFQNWCKHGSSAVGASTQPGNGSMESERGRQDPTPPPRGVTSSPPSLPQGDHSHIVVPHVNAHPPSSCCSPHTAVKCCCA